MQSALDVQGSPTLQLGEHDVSSGVGVVEAGAHSFGVAGVVNSQLPEAQSELAVQAAPTGQWGAQEGVVGVGVGFADPSQVFVASLQYQEAHGTRGSQG